MPPSSTANNGSATPLPGVTAVLCTRLRDAEGFPRVPSLVASLSRFASAGTISELLVSTPARDVQPLSTALASEGAPLWSNGGLWSSPACRGYARLATSERPFPARVVSDTEVLPSPRELLTSLTPRAERAERGGRGANYRIQMLIKLGIARLVRTTHYLTLDRSVLG